MDTFNDGILTGTALPMFPEAINLTTTASPSSTGWLVKERAEAPGSLPHRPGSCLLFQGFCQAHSHYDILRSMSRRGTPTDTSIIEALNGWKKEEFDLEFDLDFDLGHAQNIPALLDQCVFFFNNQRRAAAPGYKSPVRFCTELGFP